MDANPSPASPSVSPIAEAPEATSEIRRLTRTETSIIEAKLNDGRPAPEYYRVLASPAIILTVSPTCEVLRANRDAADPLFCDAPSTHWYPTSDGGTMALCAAHAKGHHATRIAESLPQRSDDRPSVLSEEEQHELDFLRDVAAHGGTAYVTERAAEILLGLFARLTSGGSDDRAGVTPAVSGLVAEVEKAFDLMVEASIDCEAPFVPRRDVTRRITAAVEALRPLRARLSGRESA